MVKLIWMLVILVMFALTVNSALADIPPFDQCVEVRWWPNGSINPNLTCQFDNLTSKFPMPYNSSKNQYCFEINSSYSRGTYNFLSHCTDGKWNRTVFGTFSVTASVPKASSAGSSTPPILIPLEGDYIYSGEVTIIGKPGQLIEKNVSINNNQDYISENVLFSCEGEICDFIKFPKKQYFSSLETKNIKVSGFIPVLPLKQKYLGQLNFKDESINLILSINLPFMNKVYIHLFSKNLTLGFPLFIIYLLLIVLIAVLLFFYLKIMKLQN